MDPRVGNSNFHGAAANHDNPTPGAPVNTSHVPILPLPPPSQPEPTEENVPEWFSLCYSFLEGKMGGDDETKKLLEKYANLEKLMGYEVCKYLLFEPPHSTVSYVGWIASQRKSPKTRLQLYLTQREIRYSSSFAL